MPTHDLPVIGETTGVVTTPDDTEVWVRLHTYEFELDSAQLRVRGRIQIDPDDWQRLYRAELTHAGLMAEWPE